MIEEISKLLYEHTELVEWSEFKDHEELTENLLDRILNKVIDNVKETLKGD
jgi:hypothetical protein